MDKNELAIGCRHSAIILYGGRGTARWFQEYERKTICRARTVVEAFIIF